jgi:arylsulfatase A-like enzyme
VSPESGLAQGFRSFRDVPRERGRAGAAETLEVLRSELDARRSDGDRAGRPLFLFVNLMEPHLPYDPPEEAERPFRPPGVPESEVRRMRRFQFPEDMAHNLGVRPLDALAISILPGLYDGEVLALDGGCAALEALLAKEGVLGPGADGLLVVTSDHGENLGEHGLVDQKLSVADTLLRVPLVARWPGRLEGGRRVGGQVRLQDLFPTLLEAGGAPAGAGEAPRASSLLGGREEDLPQVSEFVPPLSFLAGMRAVFPDRPESTFERFRHGLLAVTAPEEGGRRLKWVRDWVQGDGAQGPPVSREALFDLAADPGEGRDLLAGPGQDPADLRAARRLSALADEWTAR